MARKISYRHLEVLLGYSPFSRSLRFPVDEATAAPVIKYMDHMLDQEILSQDGEHSASDQEDVIDMVMRAKGTLELILGRRIELNNAE